MTKKDYIHIANGMVDFIDSSSDNGYTITIGHALNLIDIMGAVLKQDNPRFDIAKFQSYIRSHTKRKLDW